MLVYEARLRGVVMNVFLSRDSRAVKISTYFSKSIFYHTSHLPAHDLSTAQGGLGETRNFLACVPTLHSIFLLLMFYATAFGESRQACTRFRRYRWGLWWEHLMPSSGTALVSYTLDLR